ncbi:glycoside hydrolase family 98 domain-containing protein, partial [Peptoniphilus rhinitidis]|uniref:glycoside hydrolase family 98 domain-containing protein n=1 Tax=Peptoniphilus rhinitidis TaxID=1175452 RepID=UPI002909E725
NIENYWIYNDQIATNSAKYLEVCAKYGAHFIWHDHENWFWQNVMRNENFYNALDKFLEEIKMLTLFVSSHCPDCPPAIEEIKRKNLDVEIVDITASMSNLKKFLKYRDFSDYFDEIVDAGKVGVPALMRDDEFYFFDGNLDEFLEG